MPALRFPLPGRTALRLALPALALAVFGTALWHKITALDAGAIRAALSAMSPMQLGLAALFTALSLRAVGSYDALMHEVLDSPVARGRARRAGTRAIALAQTLGFGTVTGALVRWRLLPELEFGAAMRLSVLVSLSFMGALAVVTALVLPLSGLANARAGLAITVGLGIALALLALAFLAHRLGWLSRPLAPATVGRLVGATLLDTAAAAAALWVLWPEPMAFQVMLAAYLVALGAGLLSSAPGGVGAFDLALLALLPEGDEGAMAALLAFRVIYYALPACLALLTLIRPKPPAGLHRVSGPSRPDDPPESGLARQDAALLGDGQRRYLALRAPYVLAIKGPAPPLASLGRRSGDEGRRPVLYQCDAPTAAAARRTGWTVLRIAEEAIITLADWTTAGPHHRQLRRKLAQAAKAGVRISETRGGTALAAVNSAWTREHGREKGLTMGRFDPEYLRHQRVFVARHDGRTVAFLSFHATGPQWGLDLMRHETDLPNGTMHALLAHALDTARGDGVDTLSLAAVPNCPLPFANHVTRKARGLRQFKTSFAPTWQPRYLAAPTRLDCALSLASLALAIHTLPPLRQGSLHDDDANISFEPAPMPCHALPEPTPPPGAPFHVQCPDPPA